MGITQAKLAYKDCEEAWEKARSAEHGCRVRVPGYNEAINLRMRLHQCRELDRKEQRRVYEATPEHPMYGSSAWDGLVCRLREADDSWWVYIEKRGAGILEIEPLGEPQMMIEHKPTPQIAHEPIRLIAGPVVRRRV